MTEEEWTTGERTDPLFAFLRDEITARMMWLFVAACRRRLIDLEGKQFRFERSSEDWERSADDPGPAGGRAADLAAAANDTAEGLAWAAHFDPAGCSGEPFAPAARSFEVVQAEQCGMLRDIVGNPFCRSTFVPHCRTPTVLGLASAAYDLRILPSGLLDPARLAVLSDALEEAGCGDTDILLHLRGPGPHVRGCWAVDLILGKG